MKDENTSPNTMEVLPTNGRYDRQLRLWGPIGQEYLAEGVVLCFGSTLDVQEAIKNLVLPGVGEVVIVDKPVPCTQEDLTHSFILGGTGLGEPRHECVATGMRRLNPACNISTLTFDEPLDYFKSVMKMENTSHSRSLSSFPSESILPMVIIGSDFATASRRFLGERSLAQQIEGPSVAVMKCNYFNGYLSIYGRGHYCIDDHERDGRDLKFDLRFPEIRTKFDDLRAWLEGYTPELLSLSQTDDEVLAHIPWLNLLWMVDQTFAERHQRSPERADVKECQEILASLNPKPEDGQLNFQEAKTRLALLWQSDLPYPYPGVEAFLSGESSKTSSRAQIAMKAANLFHAKHGRYPLTGKCPDMTSTTDVYNTLSKKVRAQSAQDLALLESCVEKVEPGIAMAAFRPFLKYIIPHLPYLVLDTMDPAFAPARTPEMTSEDTEDGKRILAALEGTEDVRLAAASGTLIGATASQEAVKLITHQWKPRIQDTIVWNGYNNMTYYIEESN